MTKPHATDYSASQTFTAGDRVEIHPNCDLWMQGARYGTIVRPSIAVTDAYMVRMDRADVEGLKTFRIDRLRHAY